MNINLKAIISKLLPVLDRIKKYGAFSVFIIVLGVYAFLILSIDRMSQVEPSEAAVQEKLQTVQVPKLDQATLNKINDLRDQNVQVKALFDQARNNPFAE